MFLNEDIMRPTRISRKITLFQVCFMLLLIDAEPQAFIWNYYIEQLFPVVCSAFSNPRSKWNMITSSYSSNTFTEVLRIPALKHVVLKAQCKAETAAEKMTVGSVVSCSNTMPFLYF